jgi:glycosyltransferase involved in cell wall biosynthesis
MTPLRVAMYQPALAHYRLPVFRELAERPGLDLHVFFGRRPHLDNVEPVGFAGTPTQPRHLRVGRETFLWDSGQLACVDGRRWDVAILPWDIHYASLPVALATSRARGVSTVLWGHGYSKHESRSRRVLRNAVGHGADAVLLYDATTARGLVDQGFPAERVFAAPNTIDQAPIQEAAAPYRMDPVRVDDFRRCNDLPGPVLVFVSRLLENNRVDWLIAATDRLKQQIPNVRTVIVGDGPARTALQREVTRRSLECHVRFTGAIYSEPDLAPWMCAASVFVYPTNIGLSLFHAFGYGLPVVVGDDRSRQNPEIDAFKSGHNGLTYRQGDIEDLADTLERVLRNDEQRATLARNALATATQDRTISRMVDGIEAAVRAAHSRRNSQ